MNLTDINDIRELLYRHGFRFSKSLGQNFLINSAVPEAIADAAELDAGTGVMEIGPGIGCLTEKLSERAGKVTALEVDDKLKPILQETLGDKDNVTILFQDACKANLRKIAEEQFGGMHTVLCANLPYNVTTPVITAIIRAGCFDTVTIMIQREVAKRICAGAGTADYGAFGIFVCWYYEPEMLFDVSPSNFIPQPKVTSSVIRLKKRRTPPVTVKSEELMFRIIRAAFNQRRKTLSNALASGIRELSKEELNCAIKKCGIDPQIRGEMLEIHQFAKLSDEIGGHIAGDL